MKIFNRLTLVTLLGVTVVSCKKDEPVTTVTSDDVNSTSEMVVPSGFDYSATRDVHFDISTSVHWGKEKLRLDIYDFLPNGGGEIIESRFLEANGSLEGEIQLANSLKKVYAVLNYPDGSSTMMAQNVTGNTFSYNFSNQKKSRKGAVVSPNCTSGCDQSIANHSGNLNINNNDAGGVYCLTGNSSGRINVNKSGVTIRICGTANFSGINLNSGSKLEIVDGAMVAIDGLNLNSTNGNVTIYDADVTINNTFSPSGPIVNYGNLTLKNNLNINSNSGLDNYGFIDAEKGFNNSSYLNNYGAMSVTDQVSLNGNSTTLNACKMIVGGKMHFNAPVTNEGYLSVQNKLVVNGGGITTMKDGAMMECQDITVNAAINGTGSAVSLIKVLGQTTINGGGSLNGTLQFCDADGVENNYGSINSPAALACDVYIPTSTCNPAGNGNPQIVDSDNDGVADDLDLYPNDPNASGAMYYPAEGQFATMAFEDLWPYAGDYDFNDLVVGYNYTMVTNANNDIIRIEAVYATKAIGAGLTNGLGVQLNCQPAAISSVSGNLLTQQFISVDANGVEQGQSKSTIVIFDNAFKTVENPGGSPYVNTQSGYDHKEADTLNVVVNLSAPLSKLQLGKAPFNPFLIVGGDRGKEVHLPGMEPTDLASNSFFGIGKDDTQPGNGKYYKSEENHPWAINVVGDFAYPEEKNDIVQSYNYFAAWAQSGGNQHSDWNQDMAGYRNASMIY